MMNLSQLYQWFEKGRDISMGQMFDWYFGIETGRDVELYDMDVNSINVANARKYQASHPWIFFRALYKLQLDWFQYHFIDLGSGKGRSLLMAAFFPFKKIIGVEFAADLCLQANRNIEKFLERRSDCQSEFEVLNMDILEYKPSTSPNLYYLYNPFDGEILKQCIDGLLPQLGPEDYFVFLNPLRGYMLEMAGMQKVFELGSPNHNKVLHVYKSMPRLTTRFEPF